LSPTALFWRGQRVTLQNNVRYWLALTGLGFCIVLVILGSVRKLIGNGSVLSKINLLLPFIQSEGLQVFDNGFLLAALAPGAFICLGLLLALRNHYQARNTLENNVEQV